MRANWKRVGVVAGVVFACSPTAPCACPPSLGIGTVTGVVRFADDTPAADVTVRVEAKLYGCGPGQARTVVDPDSTRTGTNGVYAYGIRAMGTSDTACIRVVARTGGDSVVVDGQRMRLVANYGTKAKPSTLRVDLRLP